MRHEQTVAAGACANGCGYAAGRPRSLSVCPLPPVKVSLRARTLSLLSAVLLAGAVAEAVLDGGGFDRTPQLIFGFAALLALGVAALADRATVAHMVRQPVALVLFALGALGALSAVWTVGSPGAALTWGLVTVAYGAIAVSASVLARQRHGPLLIATWIAALALVGGILGLCDATAFGGPFATDTTGYWRPAGTFGYSAALGLLEVSALPLILRGMAADSRAVMFIAALAGAVAAAVLALGHSRLECAFAIVVCVAALLWPRRTLRARRPLAATACALLAACAVGGYVIAGRHVALTAHPRQLARLGGIGALCLAAALVWLIGRSGPAWPPGRATPAGARVRLVLVGVIVALAIGVVALAAIKGDVSHTNYSQSAGFLHGRLGLWGAAVHTSSHRLLIGHGADSDLVLVAGAPSEDTMDFAQNLPLELAVELGLPGILLALALYVSGLAAAWVTRLRDRAWLFAPAVVCFLLANLLDWEWHLAGSGAVWAIALGALVAPARTHPRRGADRRGAPATAPDSAHATQHKWTHAQQYVVRASIYRPRDLSVLGAARSTASQLTRFLRGARHPEPDAGSGCRR